jgi:hypothetical protein
MPETQTPPKQGVRARERNALERITALETDLANLFGAVQNAVQELEKKLMGAAEVIDACARTLGNEVIEAAVLAAREERAAQAAVQAKEALDKALADNQIVVAEKIEENSIITGVEYDKENKPIKPGYIQLSMLGVKPEFKEKMLGQGKGFRFDTVDGNVFEVTGVYAQVPPAPEAAQPVAQA